MAASDMSSWKGAGVGRIALKRIREGETHVFETLSLKGQKYRVRILYGALEPGHILQIGKSLEEDVRLLEMFREVFGTGVILIMAFSALIGWFMARRALSGVEEVTQTALDISKGAFERRVQVRKRHDEIMRLADAFNLMLDRIHGLMTGMREITDHIAHDLKTPITRIRGLAESELTSARVSEKSLELAADTIEECDHLLLMINTLLQISETEAGVAGSVMERVDIADVVHDACELFRPLAQDKGIGITCEEAGRFYVDGDIHGLQRMIANLLENAVKYTPAGGTVMVSFSLKKDGIIIGIRDTGIGISEHDLPHLFERFYRSEPSRSQPGFGLGLSLARAVARAHGGDIKVTSRPGEGSLFNVTLPLSAPAS